MLLALYAGSVSTPSSGNQARQDCNVYQNVAATDQCQRLRQLSCIYVSLIPKSSSSIMPNGVPRNSSRQATVSRQGLGGARMQDGARADNSTGRAHCKVTQKFLGTQNSRACKTIFAGLWKIAFARPEHLVGRGYRQVNRGAFAGVLLQSNGRADGTQQASSNKILIAEAQL